VLIDEAHRTTGGDLGNYRDAGLPNASFIGFTGTPVDKTALWERDVQDVWDRTTRRVTSIGYSIRQSIEDGTTLPLYYSRRTERDARSLRIMQRSYLDLAQTEGIADIEELNKILERAVNLKTSLKAGNGSRKWLDTSQITIRNKRASRLGYKAFLVAVDREGVRVLQGGARCSLASRVLTKSSSRLTTMTALTLKKWHIDEQRERAIRKDFAKSGEDPKNPDSFTEKLLTGYDAPILYALYLDKPMR